MSEGFGWLVPLRCFLQNACILDMQFMLVHSKRDVEQNRRWLGARSPELEARFKPRVTQPSRAFGAKGTESDADWAFWEIVRWLAKMWLGYDRIQASAHRSLCKRSRHNRPQANV